MWVQEELWLLLGTTLPSTSLFPSPLLPVLTPSGCELEGQGFWAAEREARQEQEEGVDISDISNLGEQEVLSRTGREEEDGGVLDVYCSYYVRERWKVLPVLVDRKLSHCLEMCP